MRVKGDPYREAEAVLGPSGEMEVSMLLVPMVTYKILHDQAKKESCTVGQVFEKAILQYLRTANGIGEVQQEQKPRPQPVAVLKRRPKT